jgi:hypothetical protein
MRSSLSILFLLISNLLFCQAQTLDGFESKKGWSFIKSDGVNVDLSVEPGMDGNAVQFNYDFTKGTGYGGIQKLFPIDLPDNYEFTFYIKADSPANNLEIKFIDSTGNNVWWVIYRNYDFPEEWKKITIKKRHISFAWGPTEDHDLKRIDRIEFTISSYVGGKGTIWLDNLKFEPLPPETDTYPAPLITASSALGNHTPNKMIDGSRNTYWQSSSTQEESVTINFTTRREFGGIEIDWLEDHYAVSFQVLTSDDGENWEKAYLVGSNKSNTSFIRMPESEAKFLKISLLRYKAEDGFGIREIRFLNIKNSITPNDFLIYAAKNSPRGNYPRYFLEQAQDWTITGVNNDVKEALISEDGMVEVDKGLFSLEPMIRIGDSLYNWSNVKAEQSLGFSGDPGEFQFLPTVAWPLDNLNFNVAVTSAGEANVNSRLDIRYTFENLSKEAKDVDFYLLIRPFQVNPYYQWLNLTGGAGKINSITETGRGIAVDKKLIIPMDKYEAFGAVNFNAGNLVDMARNGVIPAEKAAEDQNNMANGVIKYSLHLNPGEKKDLYFMVPFYGEDPTGGYPGKEVVIEDFRQVPLYWKERADHIKFNLPPSANRIVDTYKSNLVYILINKDKAGIQPGSRSYERSWIRDGSLTSSALLKSGIVPEVKDFINWYASFQYENGKVPCVVDFRGPDPVPENDSHGELIYAIREYYNFTKDTAFLRENNVHVLKAVDYIESLVAQRSTDYYRNGNDSVRALYGLMTESISHEGYSAKPMHSYWDDFFTLKGLKDAAEIQLILGETDNYNKIKQIRDTFEVNLYNSINLTMKYHQIDYIPGCSELGDFDATSTTIALTPCNELKNLPKPQVYNTFDRYFLFFTNRRDGNVRWVNYTPYENRLIGSFIILDEPERAHALIEYFLNDQRPHGFNHWAEVVWSEYRYPGYIGDMPHTWVGSDFINAIRTMFVYENEYDQSIVLASALYQDWIDAKDGMSVENLPTYYGEISYSIKKEGKRYAFNIYGDVKLPSNGIKIRNFNGSQMPLKVTVNGKEIKEFNEKEISVKEFPAKVLIYY